MPTLSGQRVGSQEPTALSCLNARPEKWRETLSPCTQCSVWWAMSARSQLWSFVGLLLAGFAWADEAPAPPALAASAPKVGIADATGRHRLFKRDIACPAADGLSSTLRGAVLEPGHEMNPEPDTLQPIVRSGQRGFVVAAGTTMLSGGLFRGGTDILIAGLDDDFSPRWATLFGGPASDFPISVAETRDGGYVAISHTRSLWFSTLFRWVAKGNQAALLSKYTAEGALEWVQYLTPGDEPGGYSIVVPADGGILVGGTAQRENRFAGFLVKLDDQGAVHWAREVGRDHEDGIAHLEVLRDGGVLASGSYRPVRLSPYGVWVARLADDGTAIWARSYGTAVGGNTGIAFPVSDGGALVIRSPKYQDSAPRSRVAVFAVTADGTVRWSRVLDFEERVTLSNFAEPSPGRYLLFGGAAASEDVAGPLVVELDAAGQFVDSRAIDIAGVAARRDVKIAASDQPISVVRKPGGGFVLLGNLISIPVDLVDRLRRARSAADFDADLRARVRMQVFLLAIGESTPVGPCTRGVQVTLSEQPVDTRAIDLPTRDLPKNVLTPVPRLNLGVQYLRP